jgi:hypothetical protein
MGIDKNELKKFAKKYGIDLESTIMDDNFTTIKIPKENFDKENLIDRIKKVVCKGYVKKDLLYYIETEYQKNKYVDPMPMVLTVYTDQECSDSRFMKDLEEFVDEIIDIYNGIKQPTVDNILAIKSIYYVGLTELQLVVRYYVFLSIEDVYEKDGIVYVTLGLYN